MTAKTFFAGIRSRLYNGPLAQSQIDGINAVIDAYVIDGGTDPQELSYILATVFNETGGAFEGIEENLTYTTVKRLRAVWPSRFKTDASAQPYLRKPVALGEKVYGNRADLGNDKEGDGYTYRGRGLAQITGKAAYKRFGDLLHLDLVNHPELVMDIALGARILVVGMRRGLFTGKKLSDYIAPGQKPNYTQARATVNGDVRLNGPKIAAWAREIEACLEGTTLAELVTPEAHPDTPDPVQVPEAPVPQPPDVEAPLPAEPAPSIGKISWLRIGIAVVLIISAVYLIFFR